MALLDNYIIKVSTQLDVSDLHWPPLQQSIDILIILCTARLSTRIHLLLSDMMRMRCCCCVRMYPIICVLLFLEMRLSRTIFREGHFFVFAR